MKKLLRLFMLAVLFLPLALNAQTSWTVADGTTLHAKVPLDFYNCDGSGVRHAQMLYPASLLTDMTGSTIGSITFYHQSSASKTLTASTWYIMMGTTTEADLSEGFSTVELDTVYAGNLVVTGGVFSFEFTTPYTYNGGNLIVEIYTTGASGNYFGSSNQGCYGVDEIGSTYSSMSSPNYTAFLPKTTFTEAPSCFPVTNLAVNGNTTNSISLSWTDANNTGATYTVYDMADSSVIENGISGTTYTVTGLNPNTLYTFGVEANCTPTDASATTTTSGRTACAAISELPYTMGFENEDLQGTTNALLFPYCWTRINTLASGTYTYYPYAYNYGTPLNGSRHLYFSASSYGTYADTTGFVMPELDVTTYPMNANRVTFWAKVTSTTDYSVQVGTMSDPEDMETFTLANTVTVTGTSYAMYSVSLADAPSTDAYVAFIVPKVASTMYIDDVTLEELPSCLEISNLAVSGTTSNSITLSWVDEANPDGTSYTIYNMPEEEEMTDVTFDGTTAIVSGLDANTQYTLGVQANCPSGNASIMTVSGRTSCAVEALPYSETFDVSLNSDPCWRGATGVTADEAMAGTALTLTANSQWTYSSAASNGLEAGHYRVNIYGTSCKKWMITPEIDLSEATNPLLTFDAAFTVYSSNSNDPATGFEDNASQAFKVLVTTDGGQTWSLASDISLTSIASSTYLPQYVNLSEYAGETVRVAFYAQSTVSGGDNNLHIDNILIEESIGEICYPVTGLTASNVTAHEATLTWSGDVESYTIYDLSDSSEVATVNNYDTTYSLTGLASASQHSFGVVANCTSGSSVMVSVTFTTLVSCVAPTNVAVALTPGDGSVATVNWIDTIGAAWQLCLNGDTIDLYDADETSYTFDELTPEQTYTVMVRTNCSSDGEGFSAWTSVVNFTPTDAYSITVNEGTTTNNYVPVYGLWVDNITKSQFIIPATDLTAMQFGNINKLTFYSSTDDAPWTNASFNVYLTETNETTVESLADYDEMTLVYTGSLSIVNNKMEVNFTTPFTYMGGNLMIGFLQTVSGTYKGCSWYGVTATGASQGGYGSSISQQNFLPKTTIAYTPGEEPDCLPVNGLAASEITTEGATLTWNGDADSYNVYVINGTDTTLAEQNVSENTLALTGLTAMTSYTYGVRSVCPNDESEMVIVTFATACAAVELPYTETFETTSATRGCWELISNNAENIGGTYGMGFVTINNHNVLRFSSYSSASDYNQYGYSPLMEVSSDATNLMVNVVYATYGSTDELYFGYITDTDTIWDPTPYSTDNNSSASNWQTYTAVIPATATQLAIHYYGNYKYYAWIDSVSVTEMTGDYCYAVTNLTVDSTTTSSVFLSWTDNNNTGITYTIYNGTTEVATNVATTNYEVTGLGASSNYTFGVVANCSATDASDMVTINAITECGDVTALPYTEGFENGLGCWTTVNGSSDGQPWFAYNCAGLTNIGPHSGNYVASSWSWNSDPMHANAWLISPKFVLPNTTEGLTFTWWEATSAGYPDSYSVVLSTTTNDTASFTTVVRPYGVAAGEWTQQAIDLSSYAGQSIYIAFHHVDYDMNYLLIDDIELSQGGYVPPTPDTLTVTFAVNDATMGTTIPAPGTHQYAASETVEVLAVPNPGYHFEGWIWEFEDFVDTLDADYISLNFPASVFVEYSPMTFTALFAAGNPDSTTITYAVNDPTMGTITPAPGTYTIYVGNSVVATATPNAGYELNGWVTSFYSGSTLVNSDTILSDDDEFDNPIDFGTIPQTFADNDITIAVTALFAASTPIDLMTVNFAVNNPTLGTMTPAPGTVQYLALGDSIILTAMPNPGATFNGFSVIYNGQTIVTSPSQVNPITFPITPMVFNLGEVTLMAMFSDSTTVPDSLTLIINTADATMGTTSPVPGTYTYAVGETSVVAAIPNPGYHLLYWVETFSMLGYTINDTIYGYDTISSEITPMMANMTLTLTAYFEADSTPVVVCNTPTGLHYTAIENHAIAIAWDADANVNSWNIRYRMSGNGAWNTATSNTNSYTISGLQGLTSYDIEVQANCGDGNVSEWCDAITVQTTNVGIVNHLENSVVLFPNPAREYVDIRIDGEFNVSSMEVYDVYGKLINNINVVDNPTRIYVSNLSNGMYFVRVTTDAGVVTKTFVKK